MKLLLDRKYKLATYTIGKLYIDGKYFCDTLEDTDRGLTSDMDIKTISEKKVYGETAIPRGEYIIKMGVVSPKFKSKSWAKKWGGKLPRLQNVKGFDGVLIHPLNKPDETLGCIGVGENKVKGQVINSSLTFDRLMPLLIEAYYRDEDITLTIK